MDEQKRQELDRLAMRILDMSQDKARGIAVYRILMGARDE